MGDEARTVFSVLGHEIASPLSAFFMFLSLAEKQHGPLPQLRLCGERLEAIVKASHALAHEDDRRALLVEVAERATGATGVTTGNVTTFGTATAWTAITTKSMTLWSIGYLAGEVGATAQVGETDGTVAVRIEWPT
jgi:hypothetical protein